MTDLDKKLEDIIDLIAYAKSITEYSAVKPRAMRDIKQAFIDAGYIPYKPYAEVPDGQKPPQPVWWSKTPTIMTGQEWYDRMMREFMSVNRLYDTENDDEYVAKFSDFVAAAKKAAGIE